MSSLLTPISYEESLDRIVQRIKQVYPNYQRLESDSYSVIIEAFAYELTLLEQRRVDSIKALLINYAKGQDLDNLCTMYGVSRTMGAYPYAKYNFSLSLEAKKDLILPRGLELSDDSGEHRAYLANGEVIKAGESSVVGVVEYFKRVAIADVRCENILTTLPFELKVKAQGVFGNGINTEDDEKLRKRALLSLHSHTTAGSVKSYQYHAKSADSRIVDVAVLSASPGVVSVYLQGDIDEIAIARVQEVLQSPSVRPLTDKVEVQLALKKPQNITADIFVFDLKQGGEILKAIQKDFKDRYYRIGEALPFSNIIKDLHKEGVYKVILKEPLNDVLTQENEVISIGEISLNFKPIEEA